MALNTQKNEELHARAHEFAAGYRLIIEPDPTSGFIGHALEMPKVLAHAKTQEQCVSQLRENLIDAVATLLDLGRVPPQAATTRLTEQVNFRLSLEEKQRAEAVAQQQGYRGLGDFVRALVAHEVRS